MKEVPVYQLIGSAGSFDTLAEMNGWRYHQRNTLRGKLSSPFKLHEYSRMHKVILASTRMKRARMKGLVKARVDMIVAASICTHYLVQ